MLFTSAIALLSVLGAASAARIHPKGHADLCVQADRISLEATISMCNGNRNQEWGFKPNYFPEDSPLGTVQLRITEDDVPAAERICLEAGGQTRLDGSGEGFDPENGSPAKLATCPKGWHSARMGTDFVYNRDDGRLLLTKVHDGQDYTTHYFLEVADGRMEAGTPVQIWANNLDNVVPRQQWDIEE